MEPPSIAYEGRDVVRKSFVAVLDALLEAGCYPAVATHDEWLLERTLERVDRMPREEYELQMLLGVRERRASEPVSAGHRLRVYVPHGVRWYEYSAPTTPGEPGARDDDREGDRRTLVLACR